jgi:hypothetical protein
MLKFVFYSIIYEGLNKYSKQSKENTKNIQIYRSEIMNGGKYAFLWEKVVGKNQLNLY